MPSDIPLSYPDITDAEIKAATDVLRSGRLSIGPRQVRFEEMIAERAKRTHGVAVSSGTAGLHLVLAGLGIGPGDEVITTSFSFVASANCILYVGATPVFVDIDPVNLNMDPDKLEAAITPKTKAIIAVETFGNPAGMDRLAACAQRHEVPLIEDACEALGGVYKGKPVGSFGRAAVFAFYPNKQITTGEGGMIVTDDDRLADLCRSMRNQGRSSANNTSHEGWLAHERLGYNYRMSEIAAAIGIVQMERLDAMLLRRREVACEYIERLMEYSDLILPTVDSDTEMSWFVFVVRLTNQYSAKERDRIITGLRRHDVGCSNYFPPIHLQPFYRERFGFRQGDLPITEAIATRTIALPFFNRIDATQIELVTLTLQVMLQREQLLRPSAE
jgi:perosamine synthetase